ncbi:hypothetical protein M106_1183 [Bacteroides fragilis str. 1009-4-F |nr:hypothetical protein M106_1183 [Bacteroides fragilis str. 1009-4-F \
MLRLYTSALFLFSNFIHWQMSYFFKTLAFNIAFKRELIDPTVV